ncbi:MAG: MotA/TolQ/ExbB proton channel family protein [Planctomycetota bacterium]|nr:MAG: MotA/TolQ/ExbB proton channel family protein [Planctomycetota bacterium]
MIAHILANGGVILIAILLCSVVAAGMVLERCLRLLPLRRRSLADWQTFENAVNRGQGAHVSLGEQTPLARVIGRAQAAVPGGREAVRMSAIEAAQREVPALERGLGTIAIVAQVTPLLGLLGTVVGLMEAFQAAGESDRIVHSMLASGIYKALGTTAAGLGVAIPAYIAYSTLSGLANRHIDQLEMLAGELPLALVAGDEGQGA